MPFYACTTGLNTAIIEAGNSNSAIVQYRKQVGTGVGPMSVRKVLHRDLNWVEDNGGVVPEGARAYADRKATKAGIADVVGNHYFAAFSDPSGFCYMNFDCGAVFATKAIMVPGFTHMSLDQWYDEADAFLKEVREARLE